MTVTFGDKKLEIREWAEGKALLMTRDDEIKDAILEAMDAQPDAIEMMTEPDCVYAPEDVEGLMMAVADREKVTIILELDRMWVGVGLYQAEGTGEQ